MKVKANTTALQESRIKIFICGGGNVQWAIRVDAHSKGFGAI
jgi:hypothetical protein